MFPVLPIFLLGLPFIEIYLFIVIGSRIGAGATILLCLITALLGGNLVRYQGFSILRNVQSIGARGETPALEMLEGVVILISGILLIIPGFFTDFLALLGLIPNIRKLFITSFIFRNFSKVTMYSIGTQGTSYQNKTRIIEGQAKKEKE
ncbi:FxsA family protein [Candidatus Nitrosacidococcus sp. I8]|uniref:FxsA family protein n=1 Tax=Candidatus Nitrosacidococcus sp. I8 TaxID=2942908 RepID=UPI0022278712|nr:FxsA family protein [Candidatus Nitrosacidococcus sp. I8]CAH9014193.1 hypothetical protein NURINAE_00031 [Candidatus Nitrosacidococcus sp. I8]